MLFQLLTSIAIAIILALVGAEDYGLDCSFPIHSQESKCGNLLGDRKKFYNDFMKGCRKAFGKKASRCDITEEDRIAMNVRQPQSMVVRSLLFSLRCLRMKVRCCKKLTGVTFLAYVKL